ncbi:MAG: hypothetical protein F6K41_05170 [Symploca sp. SIO3E6]|nr:hypothetical protein [Caldora sp. SIO3E6]
MLELKCLVNAGFWAVALIWRQLTILLRTFQPPVNWSVALQAAGLCSNASCNVTKINS